MRDDPGACPKVVVFDIGNVLLHWDPRLLYRKMFVDPNRMEWFLTEVCSEAFNSKADRGAPFVDLIEALVAQFTDLSEEIRAYDERWLETTSGPIPGSIAILEELVVEGVPLYSITNFSSEKFEVARRAFEFFDCFDGIVVSGAEGLVKPEAPIYRLLLVRYGLEAADCLFIDDSSANVDGARAIGMHGYQYSDPTRLRWKLTNFGLLRRKLGAIDQKANPRERDE